MQLSFLAADGIETVEQRIAANGLLGFKFKWLVYFAAVTQNIVHQSAELRAILQGAGSPYHFTTLHALQLRIIISFGITKGIGSNIVTVLAHVEFPAAV